MSPRRHALATPAEIERRLKAGKVAVAIAKQKTEFDLQTVYGAFSISRIQDTDSLITRVLFTTGFTMQQLASEAGVDLSDVVDAYNQRRFKPSVGEDEFWGAVMRVFDFRMSVMIATRSELAQLANRSQGRRIERRELMTKRKT